jgi:hypothetical protein
VVLLIAEAYHSRSKSGSSFSGHRSAAGVLYDFPISINISAARCRRSHSSSGNRFVYREAYAKSHPLSELHLETIQDAVRGEYEREQDAKRSPSVEPPSPTKEREPEEPEP